MKIIRRGKMRSLLIWIFGFHRLGSGGRWWQFPRIKDGTFFWLRFAIRVVKP